MRAGDAPAVVELFTATFTDSEGASEGAAVGGLVAALLDLDPPGEVLGFVAEEASEPIGAVLFSRLRVDGDERAFLLSPMAVGTQAQRRGVGQALILHGLRALEDAGVRYVVTYGDPAYYAKVGFRPLDAERVVPPQELSQPIGWIGQGLGGASLDAFGGRCRCVAPFDDPDLW